jgi:hypothetical protein
MPLTILVTVFPNCTQTDLMPLTVLPSALVTYNLPRLGTPTPPTKRPLPPAAANPDRTAAPAKRPAAPAAATHDSRSTEIPYTDSYETAPTSWQRGVELIEL